MTKNILELAEAQRKAPAQTDQARVWSGNGSRRRDPSATRSLGVDTRRLAIFRVALRHGGQARFHLVDA